MTTDDATMALRAVALIESLVTEDTPSGVLLLQATEDDGELLRLASAMMAQAGALVIALARDRGCSPQDIIAGLRHAPIRGLASGEDWTVRDDGD